MKKEQIKEWHKHECTEDTNPFNNNTVEVPLSKPLKDPILPRGNSMFQIIRSWYNQRVNTHRYNNECRGFHWATKELKKGVSLHYLQEKVQESKDFDNFTDFDKGIISALATHKVNLRLSKIRVGFCLVVGGYVDLDREELPNFEQSIRTNDCGLYRDRLKYTHFESDTWDEAPSTKGDIK